MNRETAEVQNPAMLAAGSQPDVLALRQQSGLLYTRDGRPVRVGSPGLADAGLTVPVLITPEMVGRVVPVSVQVEFKTATGRQSPDQVVYAAAVRQRGGVYAVVRSAAEMLALIERIRRGEW